MGEDGPQTDSGGVKVFNKRRRRGEFKHKQNSAERFSNSYTSLFDMGSMSSLNVLSLFENPTLS